MASISQAKFNIQYSGVCSGDCDLDCSCSDTYERSEGLNALEVLETAMHGDFYLDEITCAKTGRRFSVTEIYELTSSLLELTRKHNASIECYVARKSKQS